MGLGIIMYNLFELPESAVSKNRLGKKKKLIFQNLNNWVFFLSIICHVLKRREKWMVMGLMYDW